MANLPQFTQVKWPFGNIDIQTITQAQYAAGYLGPNAGGSLGTGVPVPNQLWITNNVTIIELGSFTSAFTLNLAIDPKLQDGADITIRQVQGATAYAITPGTGFEFATPLSPTVASKTDAINAVLRNGLFVFTGGWINVR